MEYDNITDERYKPVVRLISNDFAGVAFSYNGWQDFKKSFEDVENYFSNRDDSLRDQKIHGDGWVLRFTHHDKAVEVEEEDQKRGLVGYKKRFRNSIILKFVTFKCFNRFMQKCIDTHFE